MIGCIHCCKDEVYWTFGAKKVEIGEVEDLYDLQLIADNFCYTIGDNYAAQAYLPSDYRFETLDWYLDEGKKEISGALAGLDSGGIS